MQEERLPKLIMEWIPGKRRKRGRPKKNGEGRGTSSHGKKSTRSRSVVKQKGMVFGFRKTATAVVGPEIEEETESRHNTGSMEPSFASPYSAPVHQKQRPIKSQNAVPLHINP
jgi:hypothetical protein